MDTAIAHHFVRRSAQAVTQHYQTTEDEIRTLQFPAWGLAMLTITGLLYCFIMAGVRDH